MPALHKRVFKVQTLFPRLCQVTADNYCNTNELKTCFQLPELSADVCTKSSFVLISGPKRNLEEIRSFVFTNKDIPPSDVMSFGTQVCVYMCVCVYM